MLYLQPVVKRGFLDLFAGSGFVSEFIGSKYTNKILIDEVESLIKSYHGSGTIIVGDAAASNTLANIKGKIDMAVCFAGLHHVIVEEKGGINVADTKRFQTSVLKKWKRALEKGGRLIIVDIPAIGEKCGFIESSQPHYPSANVFQCMHEKAVSNFLECIGMKNPMSTCEDLSNIDLYLTHTMERLALYNWREPEPGAFFDSFVAKKSAVGHKAFFHTAKTIQKCFLDAGFNDVKSIIIPTPWFFENRSEALWFLHELFAINCYSYVSPSEMSEKDIHVMNSMIKKYLGCYEFPDGTFSIWWKLMYTFGDHR